MREFNRFVFIALVLTTGVLGGLVLSGRMSLTAPSVAAPEPPQTRPATTAAAATGLPDLSSVAERALNVSVSIA